MNTMRVYKADLLKLKEDPQTTVPCYFNGEGDTEVHYRVSFLDENNRLMLTRTSDTDLWTVGISVSPTEESHHNGIFTTYRVFLNTVMKAIQQPIADEYPMHAVLYEKNNKFIYEIASIHIINTNDADTPLLKWKRLKEIHPDDVTSRSALFLFALQNTLQDFLDPKESPN